MDATATFRSVPACGLLLLAVLGCGGGPDRADPIGDFDARVRDYVALHRRLAAELPPPAPAEDAARIDAHRRALAAKLGAALAASDEGRVFTPAIAGALRTRLATVVDGPGGKNVRGAVLDANPSGFRVAVATPYPEAAPLSTMPPAVLAVLPPLPDVLEYRFVDHALILRDVEANLVVDVLPDALA